MPKHVSMITVDSPVVDLLARLIAEPSREPIWDEVRVLAQPHLRARKISKVCEDALREAAFEQADRSLDYFVFTVGRPYLITASEPEECASIVDEYLAAKTDEQTREIAVGQLGRLKELCDLDYIEDEDGGVDEQWLLDELAQFDEAIEQLQLLRDCYFAKQGVEMTDSFGGGSSSGGPRILASGEIPAVFGEVLAETYGRLQSLVSPSWWLGRDFWIGRMVHAELKGEQRVAFGLLKRQLAGIGSNPADLLEPAGIPGFGAGFDLSCPTYSTGFYFAPQRMEGLGRLLSVSGDRWSEFARSATGLSTKELKFGHQMLLEALAWAEHKGCGLIEGNELVSDPDFL